MGFQKGFFYIESVKAFSNKTNYVLYFIPLNSQEGNFLSFLCIFVHIK